MNLFIKNKPTLITSFILSSLSPASLLAMEDSTSLSQQESPQDRLSALPDELQQRILGELDAKSLVKMSQTSEHFHNQADDENLWKELCRQEGLEADPDKTIKQSYIHQSRTLVILLKKLRNSFNMEAPVNPKEHNSFFSEVIELSDKEDSIKKVYDYITSSINFLNLKGFFDDALMRTLNGSTENGSFVEEVSIEALNAAGIDTYKNSLTDWYGLAYERSISFLVEADTQQLVAIDASSHSVKVLKAYQEMKAAVRAFILRYEKEFHVEPSSATKYHFKG